MKLRLLGHQISPILRKLIVMLAHSVACIDSIYTDVLLNEILYSTNGWRVVKHWRMTSAVSRQV